MESRRRLVSTGGFRTKLRADGARKKNTLRHSFRGRALRAHDFYGPPAPAKKKAIRLCEWLFSWHTLTKSIHTASFFEIDPWFSVGGQTDPLAMMGAALDRYLPGCYSMRANGSMYCYGSKPKNVISKFSDI